MHKKPLLILALAFFTLNALSLPLLAGKNILFLSIEKQEQEPLRLHARNILEHLYRGDLDSAVSMAEAFQRDHPNSPLAHLIKARTLRETLSDQDDNKELIKQSARRIEIELRKAIDLCNEGLKHDGANPDLFFYRGWAWMFKAQIDALGSSYWSAGTAAKKGKKDIEKYLKLFPDDPDAQGILGTFLYFADTLPSVIKVIKTLFLIPGGDKEKGLKLLSYASSHEGMLTVDHMIVLSAIYTIFEGRFEDGIQSFSELIEEYPAYLRLIEPLSIVSLFCPGDIRNFQNLESASLSGYLAMQPEGLYIETVQRIRYHRSLSYMFFNPSDKAIEEFEAIVDSSPKRPDWLLPLSLLNLGILHAKAGMIDKAENDFQRILSSESMERFHGEAGRMLKNLRHAEGSDGNLLSELVNSIYDKKTRESRLLLKAYEDAFGRDLYYNLYLGEINIIEGNLEEAKEAYLSVLGCKLPEVFQIYQMLAAIRMAEINGAEGNYNNARRMLDTALGYCHKEFLLDMLIKGRKHYYEDLAEKKLGLSAPTMLSGIELSLPSSPIKD